MVDLNCCVTTCTHNEDNCCCKQQILVEGESAVTKDSTCCSSFSKRGDDSFKNSYETANTSLKVDCDAERCVYNKEHVCHADHIGISGSNASTSNETLCSTFVSK